MGTHAVSIEDRLAIVDLTIAYCWALDTHRWDDLDDVFLADATAELGSPVLEGRDAIKARIASALSPLDDSQHMVTNHEVRYAAGDTDRATCRCYLQAQHIRSSVGEGGPHFIVAGRYEDELVRTPRGWRIAFRRLVTMWTEGNVAVVRGPHRQPAP
jgi:hypothetical protein